MRNITQGELFPRPSDKRTRWLSESCCLIRDGEHVLVVVGNAPLYRYSAGDKLGERLAAAMIADAKAAPVGAVLKGFEMDDATLWRVREQLRKGGVEALVPKKPGRKPQDLDGPLAQRVLELRKRSVPIEEIARRLAVSVYRVRRVIAKASLPAPPGTETAPLPLGEDDERDSAEPPAAKEEADNTPAECAPPTRAGAALDAALGLAPEGETEPVFEDRAVVPNAGVLLAVPALEATGLLESSREVYGRLRRGIYGLRASVLLLAFLALVRRPRPEAVKTIDPRGLGDVLGLSRAPEVKTVRRKLAEVAERRKAHELMRSLAKRWLAERKDTFGVLYVDGHVRVYDGKHKLPKAHVTQKNLCLPATLDYWVNDVNGSPVFVVTPPANAAMTKVLPDLVSELEELGGGRKGTIAFDRGGWSPKLFGSLIDRGWHILTYRKGKRRKHPRAGFKRYKATIDGREVQHDLSVRPVRISGLRLREIAELRDDGGQTILVTSDFESPVLLLAHRLFARWRQENYFRYMKENFALDALVDYDVDLDDPTRDVPNPARRALDRKVTDARGALVELERAYGAAAANNAETDRPTMRGFKIANGKIGKQLRAARARVAALKAKRRVLPKRVPIGDLLGTDGVVRLSSERKLFTDAIKAAAYRAETALLGLLRPHFKRAEDEGRAFLRSALQQPGELAVSGRDVLVRLRPMSAPRFTAALRALCAALNGLEPSFPETDYRLRYEVAEAEVPATSFS